MGLPADSADCYHDLSLSRRGMLAINGVYSLDVPYNHFFSDGKHRFLPCWSVGRLIEIYEIVGENAGQCLSTDKNKSRVERLVQLYEKNVTMLNFSKLEE